MFSSQFKWINAANSNNMCKLDIGHVHTHNIITNGGETEKLQNNKFIKNVENPESKIKN